MFLALRFVLPSLMLMATLSIAQTPSYDHASYRFGSLSVDDVEPLVFDFHDDFYEDVVVAEEGAILRFMPSAIFSVLNVARKASGTIDLSGGVPGMSITALASVDVDKDGDLDVLAAVHDQVADRSKVFLVENLNNGVGAGSPYVVFPAWGAPVDLLGASFPSIPPVIGRIESLDAHSYAAGSPHFGAFLLGFTVDQSSVASGLQLMLGVFNNLVPSTTGPAQIGNPFLQAPFLYSLNLGSVTSVKSALAFADIGADLMTGTPTPLGYLHALVFHRVGNRTQLTLLPTPGDVANGVVPASTSALTVASTLGQRSIDFVTFGAANAPGTPAEKRFFYGRNSSSVQAFEVRSDGLSEALVAHQYYQAAAGEVITAAGFQDLTGNAIDEDVVIAVAGVNGAAASRKLYLSAGFAKGPNASIMPASMPLSHRVSHVKGLILDGLLNDGLVALSDTNTIEFYFPDHGPTPPMPGTSGPGPSITLQTGVTSVAGGAARMETEKVTTGLGVPGTATGLRVNTAGGRNTLKVALSGDSLLVIATTSATQGSFELYSELVPNGGLVYFPQAIVLPNIYLNSATAIQVTSVPLAGFPTPAISVTSTIPPYGAGWSLLYQAYVSDPSVPNWYISSDAHEIQLQDS